MGTYKKLKTNTYAFLKARFFGFSIFRKGLDIRSRNFAGSNESVYKDLGGGTQTKTLTFNFTMPAPRREKPSLKTENEAFGPEANEKEKLDIFIVDDEKIILDYLEKLILKKTDYNPHTFQNPYTMLDKIKKGDKCNLILLDIRMPEISGMKCLKIIKEIRSEIPVFALTAFATPEDEQAFLQHGFDDFIKKPVDAEELVEKINKIIK